ncbi:hypothetical protein LMH87_004686 [Akanthomyces muscarius]|uniref:Deoxyribonuclease NucA/NucB domain-containing protein n=1 Tax=Akanthomyces muscarius TaxID=2231603 RepID=A0A9W8Q5V0_AKAMU|nr:hypothetical protein LMH87_004686 [Akanthomyces muscarius]KAJ4145854.1 hypothetical protein LMH87_004686 [Akanthomyces muscarius]
MFRRIVAFVLAAGSVMNAVAAPSSTSVLDTRDDTDDIMMFVCDQYPDLCMNMCFGSFCAGNGQSLTFDKPDKPIQRRREQASGCRPRPGRCSTPPYGDNFECDEFPFKSVADVDGGTRINRCVPKDQNQAQGALIKAFYNSGYCKDKNPCSFNTGYENPGGIKYCAQETCENDGNEWTKGGQFNGRRNGLGLDDGVLLRLPVTCRR